MRKRDHALPGTDRKRTKIALLCVALWLCAPASFALGLGPMRTHSALDQPLRAEIEITGVQESDLRSLEVSLATKEEFVKAGIPRADHLLQLKFELARAADGRQIVQISTRKAIKEPFLQMVIAAQWSGGRIVRAYTVLLDPPLYASDKPVPVSTPKVVGADVAKSVPPLPEIGAKTFRPDIGGPSREPGSAAGEGPKKEPAPLPVGGGVSAEYGPVEKGDTLWNIASQLDTGSANVNIFQVLIALHRENPEAFINGNIHRLKKGVILKLGSVDSIAAISKQEASRAYQVQLEEWLAYKGRLAQGSVVTKLPEGKGTPRSEPALSKAEPVGEGTAVADKTVKAPEKRERKEAVKETAPELKPELKIVQAPTATPVAKEGAKAAESAAAEVLSLKNQVSTLEESLASRERENRELRERVALLETQIKNATRLVQIESQQLAQGQQAGQISAARDASKPPVAGTVVTPPPAPEAGNQPKPAEPVVKAAEAPKPVEEPKKPEETITAQAPAVVADGPKPTAAPTAQPVEKPAEKPVERKVRVEAPVPAAPGIVDNVIGFLGDTLSGWTLGGLGALILGMGGLMYYRRRRSLAEFQESVLMSGHGQTTTASEPNQNTRTDTSFLSDFGLGGVNVQADEVDPLAEAEVYLAYGRDEQAEEVLRDAAARHPDRLELKTKLLEIYKQRKDVKAFETLAEELYPASGKGDPEVWKKVAAMGRELNPENPLFAMELPVDAFERKEIFRASPAERTAVAPAKPAAVKDSPPTAAPAEGTSGFAPDAAPTAHGPDEITLASAQEEDLDLGLDAFDKPGKSDEEDLLNLAWETDKPSVTSAAPVQKFEDISLELPGGNDRGQEPVPPISQAPPSPAPTDIHDGDWKFDFGDLEAPASPTQSVPPPASPFTAESSTPIELTETTEPKWVLDAATDAAPAPHPGIAIGEEAAPAAGGDPLAWDEAATKLELARAYMDMGDKVGARSILDEVIKEGNPAQQSQAKTLVSQLTVSA